MVFKGIINKIVNIKDIEDKFNTEMKDVQLEKTDKWAIMIAAFLVFVPVIIGLAVFFFGVTWFFFIR